MAKKGTKKPRPGCRALFVASALSLAALPGCPLFRGRDISYNAETRQFTYSQGAAAGDVDAEAEFDPATGKIKVKWKSTTNYDAAQAVQIAQTQAMSQAISAGIAAALQVALPMVKAAAPAVP